ncbi:O-methyltransferase family 3 [Caldalkalibacillus thermarum TA2.A1]|uniref:O-methyltransferase n=1 Tax=Caldalkalibacillus thermarum (strain TA2.A1) TaxID=986075 RepID=F5L6C6_CALTT|nr:O-methyltransferase [Caldalkalibacillus thermarum]EGL83126.1 O-methyltransferase family 3 [Caldalkalibacillus thermarum TA2.A1]QZT32462.1 O-methyltransferase [Caldalkalibacillus thermarum TA2.A1]
MNTSDYIKTLFVQEDEVLKSVSASLAKNNMPQISVRGEAAKLLYLLVKISGAKNILEIGSLGGYSSIWLARALPDNGKLTSLELEPAYVEVAQNNVKKAGLEKKVMYIVGEARESLSRLISSGEKFDFFFIDADKENYDTYLELAIQCAAPGAIIAADNVLWDGKVLDPQNDEELTEAIRKFNEKAARDSRLESLLVPIGDGLLVSRVK